MNKPTFINGLLLVLAVFFTINTANAQCEAGFSFASDTVCAGHPVSFADTSKGTGPITYLWDFGDAGSPSNFSNLQHVTHGFVSTGNLTVKLIITDSTNCSDTFSMPIVVLGAPVVSFNRYNNCKQTQASFINTTSTGSDTVADWKWYFGSTDSSAQKNPVYTFSDTGSYTVTLIGTTVMGCVDTAIQTVKVYSKPVAMVGDTQFCAGTSISFDVQLLETSGVSYSWRFGDATSATTKSALHIYNNGGIYKPVIKVTHNGTDSCFARFDSLTVFDLPIVNFSIANDTLCYDGNNGCVQDLTSVGPFGGAITLRTVVFGDGFIDNTTPLSTTTICHSYSDPAGGAYPVTIEATDANQCFTRKQVAKAIVVLPDFEPDFTLAETKDCFSTQVDLTNTSAFDSSKLSGFKWIFGDGDTAFSGWNTASHLYTSTGNYSIQLSVTDSSGCTATKTSATAVQAVVVNFNPTINRDTSCFFNNSFTVSNPINVGATPTWIFGDGNSADSTWFLTFGYANPGNYIVRLRIQAPNCDSTKIVDTVTVLGPRANIGNPINRFQCMIHDTVYFVGNGALYMSNHGPAPGNIQRLWHFDDPVAPQCTTDTKNGVNVGLNCNFSRDSLAVKHWYTPGNEGCYRPRLYLQDTSWGCLDTSYTFLALQEPKASPDSTSVPPIPGLIFTQPDCLGPEGIKTKVTLMANTQPSCARELFWVMWDSTCAAQSGSFNSFWNMNDSFHNWQYTSPPCDTGGKVTIGLVIRNGRDTAGNFCYDTAWYHNALDFNDLYPFITHDFNPSVSRCPGTTINFRVTDTLQDGITFYSWNFDDGTAVVSGANLYKIPHTFNQAGQYAVTLTMTNADGCSGSLDTTITIGFDGDFGVSEAEGCVGDTLDFIEDVFYFDIGSSHWLNPARHAAGKETLWWDFGDGRGFATQGARPSVAFNKAGTYTVKLALKDSSGCTDTIVKPNLFTIYGTYARFILEDTIVCPQLLQLKDSSRIFDPDSFVNIPAGDSISKWQWVFNNGPKSFIKNPFFDFGAGGGYTIRLKVENLHGCIDSTEDSVYVKGPVPLFSIIGDSTGCSPLKVTFKNESVNANKYTWNFNDAQQNTLTTLSDSDVYNVYIGGGVFQPFLTAESSEFDSKKGITVTCRANYPDTSLGTIRVISVRGTPEAKFGNSNACSNYTLNFTDSSTIDSGTIAFYHYDFGDGSTSAQQNPSHTFADTGTYTVTQVVTSSSGCQDTFVKKISIAPPPGAVFTYSNNCHGQTTGFFDSSTTNNAFVIRWEWSFGDGTTSVLTTPTKQYLATGTYTVKLKILTNAGCADSMEKTISINPRPVVDFTAPATCMLSGVAMSNASAIASGSIAGYNWNFGDGDTSTAVNPVHAYISAGNFNIKLIATSDSGCVDSATRSVTIHPKPTVAFVVSNPQQCINTQNFVFTDNSTVSPVAALSTAWDFGDGNTSANPVETHVYSDTGIYQLRLITTSGNNCTDTGFRDIYVFPKPVADFTVNDTEQCVNNNSFVFTNTSNDTGSLTYSWDFGNGHTSSAVNPTDSFSADTVYPVRLIAQNGNNCRDTVIKYVRVLPVPVANFVINDTGQCINNNLFDFTNTSAISWGALGAQWQFGDGFTSSGFDAQHSYTKDSNFRVRLIITSDRGCSHDTFKTLTVFPKPFPQFSINDSDQCVNTNLYSFVNNTALAYGTANYVWKYGNGDTVAGVQPSYHYVADGNFIITLKATSNFGCIDSIQRQITVFPKPNSQFAVNDSDQCLNTNLYNFTGFSTIPFGGLTYQWSFSNGKTSTQQDTTIVFTTYGPVTYTLINRSDYGCYDTASSAIYVFAVPEPKFTINDTDQCLNQNNFVFTSQSTIAEGNFTHTWTFGSEGSSTQTNPVKVFVNDITHNVKLKLESDHGCTDSLTKQVIVFPSPNTLFTINDTDQCLNLNQFDFTGLSTINTGTMSWNWIMGGGFTSAQQDTSIIYTSHGPYTIRLINRSDKGCEDTATSAVYVYAVPDAEFTINDTDQCLNENSFVFTSQSTIAEGTVNHDWTFGSEGTSTAINPVFTFNNDITHTIKLKLESNYQCYDSIEKQVIVWPKPNMAFTINDTGQCVNGNVVIYTNQTNIKYGSLSYNWDLGAGMTSVATDTTVVYPVYGFYKPRLIATSNNNCKDTLTKDVSIYPKPIPAFLVNDSDQCLSGNRYIINNQTTLGYGTLNFIWYWGNGDTSSGVQPQYTYPADTIYVIKMVATSNWGCKDSFERQIIVYPQPVVAFTINDSGQCVNNNQFDFTNGSTVKYGTLNYNWNFANGKTAVQKDTSIVYTYDSTYRAVLRVTTNFGCTDTVGKYVVVHSKPNPGFTTNDTDQCVNADLFVYTNLTTIKQGTSAYDWDFGDGTTDTVTHPSHGYIADTTYRVRLLATSDFGCVDSFIRFMLVFPKPQAAFTVNDSSQCINTNNFVFSNQSTVKYGTLTHEWQYGNGDVSAVQDPVYVYPLQGTYTVTLIPRSNNNCYDTVTHLSILFPKPNPLFSINDTDQCLKIQAFIFKDSSNIDSGTYATRWWFSDAVIVKDSLQVTRVFGSQGTYDVELLLTSDEGCKDSIQRQVVVYPHPNPNFTGLKTYYCMDDTPLPLTPTVPGGIFSGLNMVNDTFAPTIPGFDTVRYSVTVNGCTSDTAKYTRVYPLPVLGLPPDTTLCRQEFLVFDVTFPGSTYLWQDGNTSPKYIVRNPGLYKVTLFNICDTMTADINVQYLDYDCNFFFSNAFSPNGDGVNDVWLPYMEDVVEMHLTIYNRWGQMVFESTDFTKGWDGRYMGEPVQDGVYIWKVDLKIDESGNLYMHSTGGNLTLLR